MAHPAVRLVVDTVGDCSVAGSRVRIGFETVVVLAWVLVAVLEEERVYPNAAQEGSSQEDSDLAVGIAVLSGDFAAAADIPAENPVALVEPGSPASVAVDSLAEAAAAAAAADSCPMAVVHQEDPEGSCKYPIASNQHYRHPLHWNRKIRACSSPGPTILRKKIGRLGRQSYIHIKSTSARIKHYLYFWFGYPEQLLCNQLLLFVL